MKKLNMITEGIIGDMVRRDLTGREKKENGKKVRTNLGIDIFLQNPECDYDKYIIETIDNTGYTEYDIINEQDLKTTKYKSFDNIKQTHPDYVYIIYEGKYHSGLAMTLSSYDDILDFVLDDDFKNEYSEHDYKEICNCIAKKFKELGQYIQSTSNNVNSLNDCDNLSKYRGNFMFQLIDEDDVAHWNYENYENIGEDYNLNTFYEDFIYHFNDMKYEDIITWSYNHDGSSIGIPITYDNMMKFQEYRDYTKKWFNI